MRQVFSVLSCTNPQQRPPTRPGKTALPSPLSLVSFSSETLARLASEAPVCGSALLFPLLTFTIRASSCVCLLCAANNCQNAYISTADSMVA